MALGLHSSRRNFLVGAGGFAGAAAAARLMPGAAFAAEAGGA